MSKKFLQLNYKLYCLGIIKNARCHVANEKNRRKVSATRGIFRTTA